MLTIQGYLKKCEESRGSYAAMVAKRDAESNQRTTEMFQHMQQENAKYKWYQIPPCPQPRPRGENVLVGMTRLGRFFDEGWSYAPGTIFERVVEVEGPECITKVTLHYKATNRYVFAPTESEGELIEEDKKMLRERFPNRFVDGYFTVCDLTPNRDRIVTPVYSNTYWRRLWWRFLNPFQRFRWAFQNPEIHLRASFMSTILIYIVAMLVSTIFYQRWLCYIFFSIWFFYKLMVAYGGWCDEYPFL